MPTTGRNICKRCRFHQVRPQDIARPERDQFGFCQLPQHIGTLARQECPDFKTKEPFNAQMRRANAENQLNKMRDLLGKKNPED
jgi:hypothetical protein